jgi:hypothetical protein
VPTLNQLAALGKLQRKSQWNVNEQKSLMRADALMFIQLRSPEKKTEQTKQKQKRANKAKTKASEQTKAREKLKKASKKSKRASEQSKNKSERKK